jgi:hypothetical protein
VMCEEGQRGLDSGPAGRTGNRSRHRDLPVRLAGRSA